MGLFDDLTFEKFEKIDFCHRHLLKMSELDYNIPIILGLILEKSKGKIENTEVLCYFFAFFLETFEKNTYICAQIYKCARIYKYK